MAVTQDNLRTLHRVLLQLRDLRDRRDRGPRQAQAREAGVVKAEQQLQKIRDDVKAAQLAANSKEGALKANESKIDGLRVKLNQCQTNKEYKALMDQIEADKMACSVLQDEILEALDKVETLKQLAPPAEEEVKKAKAELDKVRGRVSDEAATIKSEITRLEADLKASEDLLPPDVRDGYQRALKGLGEGALSPVEGDICSGCNRQITTNMLSDLMMSKLVFCKSCGCLLYMPEGRR